MDEGSKAASVHRRTRFRQSHDDAILAMGQAGPAVWQP
jgi:hypothetical protein